MRIPCHTKESVRLCGRRESGAILKKETELWVLQVVLPKKLAKRLHRHENDAVIRTDWEAADAMQAAVFNKRSEEKISKDTFISGI